MLARKKYECIAHSQQHLPKNASILINYALSGNGELSVPNHPSNDGVKAKSNYKDSVESSGWHCISHQGLHLLTVRTAHTLDHNQALGNPGKRRGQTLSELEHMALPQVFVLRG